MNLLLSVAVLYFAGVTVFSLLTWHWYATGKLRGENPWSVAWDVVKWPWVMADIIWHETRRDHR